VRRSERIDRERGVAMVLVLGLVALIAAWAIAAASEDQVLLRRAENQQAAAKAMLGAESGLELARIVLREDRKKGDNDHLGEEWASNMPPMPVDDGAVAGSIVDANRFYNLNDLVKDGSVQAEELLIVQRLLGAIDLPGEMAAALADWMDADNLPLAAGAEDASYLERNYRVKNAPLDALEELRLVKGFDAAAVEKLSRVAVVAPSNGKTRINLNTAPREVLMAVLGISGAEADGLIAQREGSPFTAATLPTGPTAAVWATAPNVARISAASDRFLVRAQGRFGRAVWGEKMLVQRNAQGELQILARQRMGWTEQL